MHITDVAYNKLFYCLLPKYLGQRRHGRGRFMAGEVDLSVSHLYLWCDKNALISYWLHTTRCRYTHQQQMDAITRHALKIPRYYLSKRFPLWFELQGEVFKWSKFISNLMTYFLRSSIEIYASFANIYVVKNSL